MSGLTLIIPAKNEKESLPKVLDELGNFNFKKNIPEIINYLFHEGEFF